MRLLPTPTLAAAPAMAGFNSIGLPANPLAASSRLVGLDDLLPPTQAPLVSAHSQPEQFGSAPRRGIAAAADSALDVAPGRSQWPTPPGPPASWQAPAAPYVGASGADAIATAAFASTMAGNASGASSATSAYSQPGAAIAVAASSTSAAAPATPRHPDSQLLSPPPPRPSGQAAAESAPVFEETVEEMGAAEASDLDAPEDDLTLDENFTARNSRRATGNGSAPEPGGAPAAGAAAAHSAVSPETGVISDASDFPASYASSSLHTASTTAAPAYTPRLPRLDGLNYRMIQYARQAMQLVAGHGDFGVIYAPAWPAWLAALEIRNRSGRPLVLYAAALPSDTTQPAERGWLLHVERQALRRATLVLVPDALMQLLLRARHGADLGEVRIVPAGDEVALQLVLAEVAVG